MHPMSRPARAGREVVRYFDRLDDVDRHQSRRAFSFSQWNDAELPDRARVRVVSTVCGPSRVAKFFRAGLVRLRERASASLPAEHALSTPASAFKHPSSHSPGQCVSAPSLNSAATPRAQPDRPSKQDDSCLRSINGTVDGDHTAQSTPTRLLGSHVGSDRRIRPNPHQPAALSCPIHNRLPSGSSMRNSVMP